MLATRCLSVCGWGRGGVVVFLLSMVFVDGFFGGLG